MFLWTCYHGCLLEGGLDIRWLVMLCCVMLPLFRWEWISNVFRVDSISLITRPAKWKPTVLSLANASVSWHTGNKLLLTLLCIHEPVLVLESPEEKFDFITVTLRSPSNVNLNRTIVESAKKDIYKVEYILDAAWLLPFTGLYRGHYILYSLFLCVS